MALNLRIDPTEHAEGGRGMTGTASSRRRRTRRRCAGVPGLGPARLRHPPAQSHPGHGWAVVSGEAPVPPQLAEAVRPRARSAGAVARPRPSTRSGRRLAAVRRDRRRCPRAGLSRLPRRARGRPGGAGGALRARRPGCARRAAGGDRRHAQRHGHGPRPRPRARRRPRRRRRACGLGVGTGHRRVGPPGRAVGVGRAAHRRGRLRARRRLPARAPAAVVRGRRARAPAGRGAPGHVARGVPLPAAQPDPGCPGRDRRRGRVPGHGRVAPHRRCRRAPGHPGDGRAGVPSEPGRRGHERPDRRRGRAGASTPPTCSSPSACRAGAPPPRRRRCGRRPGRRTKRCSTSSATRRSTSNTSSPHRAATWATRCWPSPVWRPTVGCCARAAGSSGRRSRTDDHGHRRPSSVRSSPCPGASTSSGGRSPRSHRRRWRRTGRDLAGFVTWAERAAIDRAPGREPADAPPLPGVAHHPPVRPSLHRPVGVVVAALLRLAGAHRRASRAIRPARFRRRRARPGYPAVLARRRDHDAARRTVRRRRRRPESGPAGATTPCSSCSTAAGSGWASCAGSTGRRRSVRRGPPR